nr:PAS domain-containing protein [Kordiimonas aquimaris]
MFDSFLQRLPSNSEKISRGASRGSRFNSTEMELILAALDKSQAVIQFDVNGNILNANENFLQTLGYTLTEVVGNHHSMFVEQGYESSNEYKDFWATLRKGEFQAARYKRIGKGNKEVWIRASYNPILDKNGNVIKIIKFATDITQQVLENADFDGQIKAINKVQAIIEFELDGTILNANENFLNTVGYSLGEIKGQHHRMFVEPELAASQEYAKFWQDLAIGKFQAAQYKRLGKGGREVWIQASYNPIFDPSGKPFKIVKYATDITEQIIQTADFSGQISAIGKAQAVIEFELDGTIMNANENFLNAVGYSLSEIKGQHHRMFVDGNYANSAEYKNFWEKLGHGEFDAAEYKRIRKNGDEIWIQASYNPIFDPDGKPFKVVKYATDITAQVVAREKASRVGA